MHSNCGRIRRWLVFALGATAGVAVAAMASSRDVSAQLAPPVTGTIALEGTMEKFYKGVNVFIVKTSDGIEHMVYFTKNLLIHGGPVDGTLAVRRSATGSPADAEKVGRALAEEMLADGAASLVEEAS